MRTPGSTPNSRRREWSRLVRRNAAKTMANRRLEPEAANLLSFVPAPGCRRFFKGGTLDMKAWDEALNEAFFAVRKKSETIPLDQGGMVLPRDLEQVALGLGSALFLSFETQDGASLLDWLTDDTREFSNCDGIVVRGGRLGVLGSLLSMARASNVPEHLNPQGMRFWHALAEGFSGGAKGGSGALTVFKATASMCQRTTNLWHSGVPGMAGAMLLPTGSADWEWSRLVFAMVTNRCFVSRVLFGENGADDTVRKWRGKALDNPSSRFAGMFRSIMKSTAGAPALGSNLAREAAVTAKAVSKGREILDGAVFFGSGEVSRRGLVKLLCDDLLSMSFGGQERAAELMAGRMARILVWAGVGIPGMEGASESDYGRIFLSAAEEAELDETIAGQTSERGASFGGSL